MVYDNKNNRFLDVDVVKVPKLIKGIKPPKTPEADKVLDSILNDLYNMGDD